ncbi:MAG: glycolate oxidase subunit GlcF [Gammaproteobacteria bacterium]
MRTNFTAEQLTRPELAEANDILRKCVHCGFCNSTCPTFKLTGDELDGPRGRIYLMKEFLETQQTPTTDVVRHLDRCLSCLSCMTTCPSGVDYMHLLDTGREHIEQHHKRTMAQTILRNCLAFILPRAKLLRLLLLFAPLLRLLGPCLPPALRQAGKLATSPRPAPRQQETQQTEQNYTQEVGLLTGCVQSVMGTDINAATIRLLQRHDVKVHQLTQCCGAIEQHLGKTALARKRIKQNLLQWQDKPLPHLLSNASGCGTQLKDYAHIMQTDPTLADQARTITNTSLDITEYLQTLQLKPTNPDCTGFRVAYHSPCSMQHGQKVHLQPKQLLEQAGFIVTLIPETELCCGSAGTYNLLQPKMAQELALRKAEHINKLDVQAVATGNLGCMLQLQPHINVPIVHTVTLLDWATGGPEALKLGGRNPGLVPGAGLEPARP